MTSTSPFPATGYVDRATLVALHAAANPDAPPLGEWVLGMQDGEPIARCSQCHTVDHPGDNHPKIHIDWETPLEQHLHGDCMPAHGHGTEHPLTLKHIELARSGVHGADLNVAIKAYGASDEGQAAIQAHLADVMARNEAEAAARAGASA